jgi:Ca2+/Na+ antiporter
MIIMFGFIPMIIGMFYLFYGISLVTKNYINPSIDIIKSRNRFSSNTMNATLLAMTNSAAESFIIMNSIFFNVSDIGVYTVVGETAFYALLVQGAFYLVADYHTKIDWWIITRETIFLMIYVGIFSGFLIGNKIESWKAGILLL